MKRKIYDRSWRFVLLLVRCRMKIKGMKGEKKSSGVCGSSSSSSGGVSVEKVILLPRPSFVAKPHLFFMCVCVCVKKERDIV